MKNNLGKIGLKVKILFVVILIASVAWTQTVSYKVVSNEPPQTPRLNINTDLFQLDLMQNSLDAMSVNASVWGYYEVLPERVGMQFLVRRSWLAFGKLGEANFPPHLELDLGGYFVLNKALRKKGTKVTLKKEYSGTTYSTNYRGETTSSYSTTETFLLIPSEKKKLTMVRGGIYRKSHGNSMRYLGDEYNYSNNPEYVKFTTAGIYAGLNFRTLTSIFIDTQKYGIQYNSLGRDIYIDILLLPVNKFHNLDGGDITKEVKQYTSAGSIGFRAGYKLFQIDKRTKTGKMFGLCGNFEGGMRPYTGFFLSSGIGITFVK